MKYLYIAAFLLSSIYAQAQNKSNQWHELSNYPIKVNELVHNFGEVEQYSKIKFKFILQNDSIQPFIIKDVTTSCGCTSSAFTKKPIQQGKQGVVKVEFDASKLGTFSKSIFIYHAFGYKSIKFVITGKVIIAKTEVNKSKGGVVKKTPLIQPNTNL